MTVLGIKMHFMRIVLTHIAWNNKMTPLHKDCKKLIKQIDLKLKEMEE